MGAVGLADILVTPLARISTEGGDVLHAMKVHDSGFAAFGEAYFSQVKCGAVKAWKCHLQMTMNVVVPVGMVRFVFKGAEKDDFRVEEIGVDRYMRLTVPPGIWFGFQGLASPQSLVLNIASLPHDVNEVRRMAVTEVNYAWS
ncbi:MAG: dTDP-4-dehydrorhamnose 3,5-epimerase [Pseudomonadota bacterium]